MKILAPLLFVNCVGDRDISPVPWHGKRVRLLSAFRLKGLNCIYGSFWLYPAGPFRILERYTYGQQNTFQTQ
jgi:hypothetical protein